MKVRDKSTYYALPITIACLATIAVTFFLPYPLVREGYEKFQLPLFSGFLTIGGFLLSLKTFIVVKMNEAVYQSDQYLENAMRYQILDPSYDPMSSLKNLSSFLLFSVKWSLTSSFMQLSVGLLDSQYTTGICIGAAVGAALLVLSACFLIQQNMIVMFASWKTASEEKQKEIEKKRQKKIEKELRSLPKPTA